MTSQAKRDANNLGILEPQERLKVLTNYSSSVEIDPGIPPKRYYRSGVEMVRMANVYFNEGSYENAYVLYMKFMTLFLEKIRKHPDYASVPPTEKRINQAHLREVLPKAEELKACLLEQFTKEYNHYLNEIKRRAEEQKREKSNHHQQKTISTGLIKTELWSQGLILDPSLSNLENISYPDPNVPSAPDESDDDTADDIAQGTSQIPIIDRATKPSTGFSDSQVSRPGLRTVVTPAKVMTHFLTLSQKNTFNNIETCGILAGKLEKNSLIITHVILPKQHGTSDSCTTMNEEEIFDYQDQHNLITIGWIHTHPTQTAFLSSVDLHTHCPYQLLMPEAIAIVCAPKYEETGFYILTPNHGLSFIASCKKSGFHPHPTEPPLFMNADHVKVDGNAPLEVLDLR
ncbi:hypothetical protein RN001_004709 [Aquatica leii]|uniref:MPN domain-containing protein n=1 Tax=Aquatica leii TaxID=1421715 RepID=A0AAN7Q626_9COLE|nr:hypothetical protein RN001_004709 [Aquatica leii]